MINLKCTFAVTAGLCSSLAYAQKTTDTLS